ncbi:MAG: hypothetical protein KC535_04065 [Nanoarchaeota archaeon]|nr:hypothetical protein [Nanoarchaeota archaeon]
MKSYLTKPKTYAIALLAGATALFSSCENFNSKENNYNIIIKNSNVKIHNSTSQKTTRPYEPAQRISGKAPQQVSSQEFLDAQRTLDSLEQVVQDLKTQAKKQSKENSPKTYDCNCTGYSLDELNPDKRKLYNNKR